MFYKVKYIIVNLSKELLPVAFYNDYFFTKYCLSFDKN